MLCSCMEKGMCKVGCRGREPGVKVVCVEAGAVTLARGRFVAYVNGSLARPV
jgi:hypothetical protein